MTIVLGIDFGTNTTTAGALVGDRVELVQDGGDAVIPSVVYVPRRGPLEIGRRALMRTLSDPQGVIRSVKRVLGVPATSPMVRRFASGARFGVDTDGDRIQFKLASGNYAPEQIAGAVLARVRELAELRFGGTIRKAVIATSASPPEGYRAALRRAARIAHLEVVEMIAEPIAGALAVGLHADPADRKLVICDFGGGTFDVSAVAQSGLKFTPIATLGDPLLGGDDLDDALARGLAAAVFRKSGFDLHRDSVRWSELLMRSEAAKRQLSTQHEAPFVMREAYVDAGRPRNVDVVLERTWAEGLWAALFERVTTTIVAMLDHAAWRAGDVDRIVLIGGGAAVPLFQRVVAEIFPDGEIVIAPAADTAVAQGAVLLTARHGMVGRNVPVLESVAGLETQRIRPMREAT